jgi:hypothetical protein
MSDERDFQWLEIMAGVDQDFNVAIDRSELILLTRQSQYTSIEVMELAWNSLSADQRIASMPMVLNMYWHMRLHLREEMRLTDAARDARTFLKDGDLDIGEDALGGALILDGSLEGITDDTMVELPLAQVFRLTDEIKLLQHHLRMLKGAGDEQ